MNQIIENATKIPKFTINDTPSPNILDSTFQPLNDQIQLPQAFRNLQSVVRQLEFQMKATMSEQEKTESVLKYSYKTRTIS